MGGRLRAQLSPQRRADSIWIVVKEGDERRNSPCTEPRIREHSGWEFPLGLSQWGLTTECVHLQDKLLLTSAWGDVRITVGQGLLCAPALPFPNASVYCVLVPNPIGFACGSGWLVFLLLRCHPREAHPTLPQRCSRRVHRCWTLSSEQHLEGSLGKTAHCSLTIALTCLVTLFLRVTLWDRFLFSYTDRLSEAGQHKQ